MSRLRGRKESFDYCGKRYGAPFFLMGFAAGAAFGFIAGELMYGETPLRFVSAALFGLLFSRHFVEFLIARRRKQFSGEFFDYLDSVGSSLSCGRNSYEAFLAADDDIRALYGRETPICIESARLADGLRSGKQIAELLEEMALRSGNEDVKIFGNVYGICSDVGGDLKRIVNDTKLIISEKADIEAEISTALAEPKNELKIMALLPFVITASLKSLGNGFFGESTALVNSIALLIFVVAYFTGMKITDIKV